MCNNNNASVFHDFVRPVAVTKQPYLNPLQNPRVLHALPGEGQTIIMRKYNSTNV